MPAHPINAPAFLQSAEDPDMLTLVPLAGVGQGTEVEGAGRQVPWFGAVKGFCLVSVRLRCFFAILVLWPADHHAAACLSCEACLLALMPAIPFSPLLPSHRRSPNTLARTHPACADACGGCGRRALPHDLD